MATASDVAKRAGVSPCTVSYVMSGTRTLSPETRARVEAAMKELSYHPNAGARVLAGRRTNVIGLMARLPSIENVAALMPFIDTISSYCQYPDIDAVFCGSDQIARGVLDSARDLGRVVPDDLAVIGYDNWEVLATNSRPELTSIDANLQQLGRQAALCVFDAIDGVDIGAGAHHLPMRLVIRGSTIARR